MAKNVHQQRIGTHGRVEFLPSPIILRERATRMGVDFFKAFEPRGPFQNGGVAGVDEISVTTLVGKCLVDYDRLLAIALNMSEVALLGEGQIPKPEFVAQQSAVRTLQNRHKSSSFQKISCRPRVSIPNWCIDGDRAGLAS